MSGRVAILGAGMAGLCAALALAPTGREITLFERDPPPPEGGADAAFADWSRRGVGHMRHSHAFLARLRTLIGTEHPDLLDALRAAGARELRFADGLPETIQERYVPEPGDEELAVIVSRRTTLELVIRRHVEARPNVTIRSGVFAKGLVSEVDPSGALVARGLTLDGSPDAMADIVIDAGGRASPMIDWMEAAGVAYPEEAEDCAILYYTRFYRLRPGQGEPPRGRAPPNGDLGFLKFAVFPADNDTFSITVAVPEVEEAMRRAVVDPAIFEAICAMLPGVAPWTEEARAEPVSRVHGMGDLRSRWRDPAPAGRPVALNLFSIGDSLVRTNPLYGRGCSFAAIEAHLLRDVLGETANPAARAIRYAERVRAALRPYYQDMLRQDRAAARRARQGLDPLYRPSLRGRLIRGFLEDGVTIAIRHDPALLRAAMRGFHMLAPPAEWLGRPANLARVLAVWARGRRANARYYPEKAGPGRAEMFARLRLDAEADRRKLDAAA